MELTVHHTCSKDGGRVQVESKAPFLSEYLPEEGKRPFLGEGFYFWEFNIDYAKVWGKNHCSNYFYITEAIVDLSYTDPEYFLDLVGNRKHLMHFVSLLREFEIIESNAIDGIDLCYIIDYLRSEFHVSVFPFKVIRAIDYLNDDNVGIKIPFNNKLENHTFLNPRMLICYKSKEDILYIKKPFITFES